jgi:hypothetical protein
MAQRKPAGWPGVWSWSAAAAAMAAVWLIGNALASPQARPPAARKTSDTVFKNIQVLKDVPVDDFMGTMGVM